MDSHPVRVGSPYQYYTDTVQPVQARKGPGSSTFRRPRGLPPGPRLYSRRRPPI
ncbi:MAG: hypothetical protein MZV64_09510 [Ignavibacteriales bacterium]|nr:hypothetical protein [Ignavibacteriales bacterium]